MLWSRASSLPEVEVSAEDVPFEASARLDPTNPANANFQALTMEM